MKKDLLLIIPVYNGASYVANTVQELGDFFSHTDVTYDIMFVDDGSTDDTLTQLTRMQKTSSVVYEVLSYPHNQGKGRAIQYALQHRNDDDTYAYVGFTDIELPYGLQPVYDAVKYFERHTDIACVVGDRSQTRDATQYHWYRRIGHHVFRLFIPRSIKQFHDTQCGCKVFHYGTAQRMFDLIRTHRWVFDIELFIIAVRQQIHIYEMPVRIKPACIVKRGGVTLLRHGIYIVRDLVVIYRTLARNNYE